MSIGLLFWIVMLLWLILDIWRGWPLGPPFAGSLILFVLLVILGWHAFGAPVK